MSNCTYRKGLISLRDCGEPAEGYCRQCNRPICRKHTKVSQKGSFCPECFVQDEPGQVDDDTWISHHRRRLYGSSGYSPFYYGHRHRYGDDDYRYFDQEQNPGKDQKETWNGAGIPAEAPDTDDDIDADDFQDS